MEVRRYIENQMLNDTAWADRDADRVPMEDEVEICEPMFEIGDKVTNGETVMEVSDMFQNVWLEWIYECISEDGCTEEREDNLSAV